jgi:hypothetical protein
MAARASLDSPMPDALRGSSMINLVLIVGAVTGGGFVGAGGAGGGTGLGASPVGYSGSGWSGHGGSGRRGHRGSVHRCTRVIVSANADTPLSLPSHFHHRRRVAKRYQTTPVPNRLPNWSIALSSPPNPRRRDQPQGRSQRVRPPSARLIPPSKGAPSGANRDSTTPNDHSLAHRRTKDQRSHTRCCFFWGQGIAG